MATNDKPLQMDQDEPLWQTSYAAVDAPNDMPTPSTATTTVTAPATRVYKTRAQVQRDYRQRCKTLGRNLNKPLSGAKSNAQRQREFRQRMSANNVMANNRNQPAPMNQGQPLLSTSLNPPQTSNVRMTHAEIQRRYRIRQKAMALTTTYHQRLSTNNALMNTAHLTSANEEARAMWCAKWSPSINRLKKIFNDNEFGHACSVCDRLWFRNDIRNINAAQLQVISDYHLRLNEPLRDGEYTVVCNTCRLSLNKGSMPRLAKINGFSYPEIPPGLPPLDPISERLISPRLPFMQVRRLRNDFSYGITGQVINVPVDVDKMVKCLPRHLEEDRAINVNIKRNLAHKSVYVGGYTKKTTIKAWLNMLQNTPLYKLYDINVGLSRLDSPVPPCDDIEGDETLPRIETISDESSPDSEILGARQHTMLWNEEDCLYIAPGHQAKSLNIIYDRHAEELSFPSVYYGKPCFKLDASISDHMIYTSEIRRSDRRGVIPQKILYDAMKLMRSRMVEGISNTFRNVTTTENATRRMLEDKEFLDSCLQKNLAFMKSVPNSIQYWGERKRDLFAMIRQLGKPTIFFTISANELKDIVLINLLNKLSNKYPGKVAEELNSTQRCNLVSDDPVTCCINFYKFLDCMMAMLKAKKEYNPFGRYFIQDFFIKIEFQQRGSVHAHILGWCNGDPKEPVSENMPRTIELIEHLSSVCREDVYSDAIYANQIHRHTFTCTKRGEATCRFGIPYWPMPTTRVLIPLAQTDRRRNDLKQKAKELRACLGERTYPSIDEFLQDHNLSFDEYLDVVRSSLRRPMLLFKRNIKEVMTNTFNPFIVSQTNANTDIQFVLDDYSCAAYVVEYVNKSARGSSHLHRELTKMIQEHPERDYTGQLKALSSKLLNAVEISVQEAAWYLLRQPMSKTSRELVYLPTVRPSERTRCRKRRQQMNREGVEADSTDVWTKNIIQRYEERPSSLEPVYLAEYASWYPYANDFATDGEDRIDDHDLEDEAEMDDAPPEPRVSLTSTKRYRKRNFARIIRYRRYDIDDTINHRREMVLLYVPFRNEVVDINDRRKFLQLFEDNKDVINERRRLYECNVNIDKVMAELEAMMILQNEDDVEEPKPNPEQ